MFFSIFFCLSMILFGFSRLIVCQMVFVTTLSCSLLDVKEQTDTSKRSKSIVVRISKEETPNSAEMIISDQKNRVLQNSILGKGLKGELHFPIQEGATYRVKLEF